MSDAEHPGTDFSGSGPVDYRPTDGATPTALGRVLFSQDEDLLREAAWRQQADEPFTGVIFAAQADVLIGRCVDDLLLIAQAGEPEEFANAVRYLPL